LKEVSSELKLTNVQFVNGEKTVKEAKSTYDNTNITIKEQREKVNNLREALSKAEKEYGANNEKVKSFKTQLNNAETQLASIENQTDKSTKELKDMKKGFDDAGGGALKFGDILKANILSEAIVSGVKKLGSVVKELGSLFIQVGKQALESYADYEQLIGGVETLFKKNASTVEKYANNAYKTAGLSANEYMETVTSFSASLLQSLGNDTAKSAKVADMAITDMADNANKMGTDMLMIQNAYQGFAKQNYTMLDNLKLGYGGTKSEMERLLSDAQKITGVKYNISNLNDVYQAIHAIQGKLGITGTTAKEASTTIQGSVNAMKSAWQNMLTGLAGNSENLKQLIDNLMTSIFGDGTEGNLGVLGNVLPVIERIIESFSSVIPAIVARLGEHLPELLNAGMELFQNLITGITTTIPQLIPALLEFINQFVQFITQNLPMILQTGITLLLELVKGISQSLPELIPIAIQCIMDLVNTLLDNIDEVIECGIELLVALTEGLMNALPELISRLPEIIIKITAKLIQLSPQLFSAAWRLITALAEGLIKYVPEMISRIPQIITSMVNAFKQGFSDFINIGKNLLKGIWEGISNTKEWLINKIKSIGSAITEAVKSLFGIHSPSTVFRDEIGKNLALGLGEGFTDTMKNVSEDIQNSIPTEFDASMEIKSNKNMQNDSLNSNLVQAFKSALKEMKIELNDREVGNFVDSKIAEMVY
uniref:hypothetical protein n=1 Tax=Methanobrevibacter smithii TaxID=2173 RepID=UPI0037DC2950